MEKGKEKPKTFTDLEACQKELAKAFKELSKVNRKLEKTKNYNKQLIEELDDLRRTLHKERQSKGLPTKSEKPSTTNSVKKDIEIQTDYAEYYHMVQTPALYEEQVVQPEAVEPAYEPMAVAEVTEDGQEQSIADQLRSAAEQAITQSDYVYDEASGMYYDHQTGYYYNPENKLYYDNTTYTFYRYNERSGQYEFHSQADMSQYEQYYNHIAAKQEKEARKAAKQAKRERREQKQAEIERKRSSKDIENSTAERKEDTSGKKRHKKAKPPKQTKQSTAKRKKSDDIQFDPDTDGMPLTIDLSMDDDAGSTESYDRKVSNKSATSDHKSTNQNQANDSSPTNQVPVLTVNESDEGEINNSSDDQEEGEITSSDEAAADDDDDELSSLSSDDDPVPPPEIAWRPPCIRAIVKESDSLYAGALHIITITGGNIGSSEDSTICIPEEKVSQCHCKITYSESDRCYYLIELGSQHGTYVNDVRMCQSGETASIRMSNRDAVRLGTTEFIFHIHPGTDTCSDCEPGVINAQSVTNLHYKNQAALGSSKADVEKARRKQLKSLKSKYGLEREQYKDQPINMTPGYEDKAEKRRQKFGIDHPHAPDSAPSSVDQAISGSNKGHKLLQKLGWKSGEGLGKSQAGIVEPIQVGVRLNSSAGLGSATNHTMSMDDGGQLPKARKKAEILLKTQKRFSKAQTNSLFNRWAEEDDEEVLEQTEKNVTQHKR